MLYTWREDFFDFFLVTPQQLLYRLFLVATSKTYNFFAEDRFIKTTLAPLAAKGRFRVQNREEFENTETEMIIINETDEDRPFMESREVRMRQKGISSGAAGAGIPRERGVIDFGNLRAASTPPNGYLQNAIELYLSQTHRLIMWSEIPFLHQLLLMWWRSPAFCLIWITLREDVLVLIQHWSSATCSFVSHDITVTSKQYTSYTTNDLLMRASGDSRRVMSCDTCRRKSHC